MVISTEPPRAGLLPVQDGDEVPPASLLDYQVVPNFRVRTIPVLGTTPAIFGMAAAAHVICAIAGFRMFPEPVFGVREGVWTSQLAALCERLALSGADLDTELDTNEVEVRCLKRVLTSCCRVAVNAPVGDYAGRRVVIQAKLGENNQNRLPFWCARYGGVCLRARCMSGGRWRVGEGGPGTWLA